MKATKEQAEAKLQQIAKSAARRGYACTLTVQNVRLILSAERCAYTGVPFDNTNHLSFDRVDNDKGYEPGNVVPVIAHVNHLKSNYDLKVIRAQIKEAKRRGTTHANNMATQILNKQEKIKARREQIADLERLLDKELNDLQVLIAEKERADELVVESQRNSEIFAKIAEVLTNNKSIGLQYMTPWQRAKLVANNLWSQKSLFTLFAYFKQNQ